LTVLWVTELRNAFPKSTYRVLKAFCQPRTLGSMGIIAQSQPRCPAVEGQNIA
jgi:hypothetical protein